jgi:signal recognition particle GTPase
LGPALASECIAQAKKIDGESPQESLFHFLSSKLSSKSHEMNLSNSTSTILVVGVNGTGKTTSVAKLAKFYKSSGKSVLMAAGDTFRAAAVDQLQTWGIRMDVPVVSGQENGDPASVAFDAAKQAQTNEVDVLIIDTAGRLHTATNLMDELLKIKRVMQKIHPSAPHEVISLRVGESLQPMRRLGVRVNQERAFEDVGNFVTDPDGFEIPGNRGTRWPDSLRNANPFSNQLSK